MDEWLKNAGGWPVELGFKSDAGKCLERIYAWYNGELLDRPPVRFARHNELYDRPDDSGRNWPSLKDRWIDTEYQLTRAVAEMEKKTFLGETFPVFWPNLGPNIMATAYGCPYIFGEVTAWAEPVLADPDEGWTLPTFDWQCEYIKKLDEMTDAALDCANGRFLVGYTDMHPGMDLCAALRGTQPLLMDTYENPDTLRALSGAYNNDFFKFYDYFDTKLKKRGQLSITWMNIPSYGKLHIPSCDFSAMISGELFAEYAMPGLIEECLHMDHNIFHVDGKGVARHLDQILTLPKLYAIQWVQGMGLDQPLLQWISLIKKIQSMGKGVIIDITLDELEPFIAEVSPRGLYLCIATNNIEEEKAVLKRLEKW
jgi:hypothetical protein